MVLQKKSILIVRSKRRGVSEIIITLMMMALTVIGAVLVFGVFQEGDILGGSGVLDEQTSTSAKLPIKIIGYDTRDGSGLGNTGLDNTADGQLCASSDGCVTDFIILKLRNTGLESILVRSLQINEVNHGFDDSISGTISESNNPSNGRFVLIDANDLGNIRDDAVIQPGSDVKAVIHLSENIGTNIKLNDAIRVVIGTIEFEPELIIVPSGAIS